MSVIGSYSMLIGVFIYQTCFSKFEMRTLTYISAGLSAATSIVSYIMIKRINIEYGISDFALLCVVEMIDMPFMMAFSLLPALVLF